MDKRVGIDSVVLSELVKMPTEDVLKIDTTFGFYDWFCKDSSLKNKAKKLLGTVRSIVKANEKGKKFDPAKCYVFFCNNCPAVGGLYDSLSICDMKSGEVLYFVAPNRDGETELAFAGHGFEMETEPHKYSSVRDMLCFFRGEGCE